MSAALLRFLAHEAWLSSAAADHARLALRTCGTAAQTRLYARHGSKSSTNISVPRNAYDSAPVSRPTHVKPPQESPDVERDELMQQAAQSASASMFPWERRHMDGGKATTFDKVYWVAFGCAISYLVVVNGWRYFTAKKEPEIDQSLEERKAEMALRLGQSVTNVLQCEDLFEGLTPQEVADAVEGAKQQEQDKRAKEQDEYDGMSPQEINDALAARSTL